MVGMERREGCRYGVQSSQDSLMDRAQGRVKGGMQADGHVSFWNWAGSPWKRSRTIGEGKVYRVPYGRAELKVTWRHRRGAAEWTPDGCG